MRVIAILLLAAPAFAATPARKCPDGSPPALTGDALMALECPRPGRPVAPALPGAAPEGATTPFTELAGTWEGSFTRGTGRYAATLTIRKTVAGPELSLETKELQMRERSRVRLVLVVEKPGRYRAKLTSLDAPGAYLFGRAEFGVASVSPAVYAATKTRPPLALIVFENGVAHRIGYTLVGDELRFKILSALPGTELAYDAIFKRAKRAKP